MEFECELGEFYKWHDGFIMWDFLSGDSYETRLKAEETEPRRRRMVHTHEAPMKNHNYKLGFTIKNLIPPELTTFSSPSWHSFLGQLTSFKISMLGQVDHDDCLSNTHEGYIGFSAQLCPLFFKHLGSSLTSLTLEAPIGCSGSCTSLGR